MGEAKRRRQRGEAAPNGIKISPRKRVAGFILVHHNRFEREMDGMIVAQNVFRVETPDGQVVSEETPEGPMPVLLMSVPQPVRRQLLSVVRA